jgi:hypothetical protein
MMLKNVIVFLFSLFYLISKQICDASSASDLNLLTETSCNILAESVRNGAIKPNSFLVRSDPKVEHGIEGASEDYYVRSVHKSPEDFNLFCSLRKTWPEDRVEKAKRKFFDNSEKKSENLSNQQHPIVR